MAKVIQFPLDKISDKDKKVIVLETYIRSNLIELAEKYKELKALAKDLRKAQVKLIQNENTGNKEK